MIKWRETYEVLDPRAIGHPTGTQIVLGKLSGRAGFAARVRDLRIELPGDAFSLAFERFQALADERREVLDEDLRRLCAEVGTAGPSRRSAQCGAAERSQQEPAQRAARRSRAK